MIIHKDALVELKYDASNDILSVTWPDIVSLTVPEIPSSMEKLGAALRHYDIKKLLIDSRFNAVEVEEEEYSDLVHALGQSLANARLQKLARVGSLDVTREPRALQHASKLLEKHKLPFDFKNFTTPAEAINWLNE